MYISIRNAPHGLKKPLIQANIFDARIARSPDIWETRWVGCFCIAKRSDGFVTRTPLSMHGCGSGNVCENRARNWKSPEKIAPIIQ